jgi:beta-N-acetylhexosaminidase
MNSINGNDILQNFNSISVNFGQMFILAFDGPRISSELIEFFRAFRIGGVILFADNFEHPRQLRELTSELQRSCTVDNTRLFIATDHEGGRVQRFTDGFTSIPPMAELAQCPSAEIESLFHRIGLELAACGINFNLAPVADLCSASRPGAIGDRSFGTNPEDTARQVCSVIRGLQRTGIMACAKHFPGHGDTDVDSHRDLPRISVTREQLDARELVPFRAAITAEVAAIMSGHVLYPQAGDTDLPASLSPHWLGKVLRRQLGFDQLVVTDAVEMNGLRQHWDPLEAGRLAIDAGSDLLIYYRIDDELEMVYELHQALAHGEIDPAIIAQSLARIRAAKIRWLQIP